jgi:hypothetical protein
MMGSPMTRRTPHQSAKPFRVLPSHERVLQALGRYDHLTAEQTRRLLFGEGSLTYVQTKYKELADAGYVLRVPLGRPTLHGSGPLVYSLDRRGRAYLHTLGMDIPKRLRQSEERERSSMHLRHSIAVADVLILSDLLCRTDGRFVLARTSGERELRARAVSVRMPDGRRRAVALDAWIDLRVSHPGGGIEQLCLGFEIDNGTEWQAAWRRKVQALLALEAGPYGAAFGVDTLTIVVVAPDAPRAAQLRAWTRQELTTQHATERADLFCFGAMPDDLSDPAPFFLSARWSIIGQEQRFPLV